MQKYQSCHEKLSETIKLLAVLDDNLKNRIVKAFDDQLHCIDPSTMPPHLIDDLIKIRTKLIKPQMSTFDTIILLDETDLFNLSQNIFWLYEHFSSYYHSGGKM